MVFSYGNWGWGLGFSGHLLLQGVEKEAGERKWAWEKQWHSHHWVWQISHCWSMRIEGMPQRVGALSSLGGTSHNRQLLRAQVPWGPSKNPYMRPMRVQHLVPAAWKRDQQLSGVGKKNSKNHREKSTSPHPILQEGTVLFSFPSSTYNSREGRREGKVVSESLWPCLPNKFCREREEEKCFVSDERLKI